MATRRETHPQKEKQPTNENDSGWHDSQLDRHRLVIACVRGNVSVRETIRTILQDALPSDAPAPLLVLGPTAPEEISNDNSNRIGWVTFVGGSSMAHPSGRVEIISPDNLLEVNLFIEKCIQESESKVIVGDFLDNVIRSINSPESFCRQHLHGLETVLRLATAAINDQLTLKLRFLERESRLLP